MNQGSFLVGDTRGPACWPASYLLHESPEIFRRQLPNLEINRGTASISDINHAWLRFSRRILKHIQPAQAYALIITPSFLVLLGIVIHENMPVVCRALASVHKCCT